jgi:UDPglucose 6-dehydrogenase
MNKNKFDVAVIGEWHLAFCTAASLADAGRKTVLVKPVGKWASDAPACPVHEPGMPEMLDKARANGNLSFMSGVSDDWSADIVWMAVDTPVSDKDEPILSPLLEIVQAVKAKREQPSVFATSSQIPLGFSRELEKALGPKIAYIPENLRLGQGIATFRNADRTVIGGSTPAIAAKVQALMAGFETKFMLCDLPTSEMVKHANNAFLATSISFANEMASIGSKFGVDNYFVAQALKLDSRIGPKAYVAPGLGFAGGTLPRDLRVIESLGRENGLATPLVSAVLEINRTTSEKVAALTLESLRPGTDRRVLILGYTYKADTDTLRRSMSVEIAESLRKAGVEVHGFDPFMNGKNLAELNGAIVHHDRIDDAPAAQVVLVMTARQAFKELDWSKLAKGSGRPLVIDTQGFLKAEALAKGGAQHRQLWAPRATT